MMDDVRLLGAIECGDLGNRPASAQNAIAAPPPGEWPQGKAFVADPLSIAAHPGGDDDVEAVVPRRPGDRQSM